MSTNHPYIIVLVTFPDLPARKLWGQLWKVLEEYTRSVLPNPEETIAWWDGETSSIDFIGAKEVPTPEELGSLMEKVFLRAKKEFSMMGLDLCKVGKYFTDAMHIIRFPPDSRWQYYVELYLHNLKELLVEKLWHEKKEETQALKEGRTVCDELMAIAKRLFLELPCDFGFGIHADLRERMIYLLCEEKAFKFIPTIDWAAGADEEVGKEKIPRLRSLFGTSDRLLIEGQIWEWTGQFPWSTGCPPIWFVLLSKERYEASKPYLPALPIEAAERFPGLKGYRLQHIEELPNGSALLFFDYPFPFAHGD